MTADLLPLIVLVAAAIVTSTVSGILGMAGGIALLGVMAAVLPAPVVIPLHGVVQLASNTTRALAFWRHVSWRLVGVFAPALAAGMAGAAVLYAGGSFSSLKPLIGAYLLFFVVWRRKAPALRSPPLWSYALLGLVVGFGALWVGATGPLLAPFFFRDDLEKEQIIASKAACQLLVHLGKLPAFLAIGFDYTAHLPLLGILIASVVVGTLLGKRILTEMKQETFLRLFEVVLVGLGLWLVLQPLLQPLLERYAAP